VRSSARGVFDLAGRPAQSHFGTKLSQGHVHLDRVHKDRRAVSMRVLKQAVEQYRVILAYWHRQADWIAAQFTRQRHLAPELGEGFRLLFRDFREWHAFR
jgi:hypothetical protein